MWRVRGPLLDAARKNQVRRVVYTSSVATMGFTSNGRPADEDSPVSLDGMIGHYKRSKFMAEQVALEAGRGGNGCGVVVNPSYAGWRAGHQAHSHGTDCRGFPEKEVSCVRGYWLNLVDVDGCARGHVAALEKGRSGERYILGGENLTLKQILDKLAAITGLPSPKVKVPYFVRW